MTEQTGQIRKENPNTDPFALLSDAQWRYVTAMIENADFNKKQGAEFVGIAPKTVYNWDSHVDKAIEQGRKDIHAAALSRRKQAVLKAIAVKVALLDSDDENIRSKAATEIIEWELGKATQRTETDVTSGGEKLQITIDYADNNPKTT